MNTRASARNDSISAYPNHVPSSVYSSHPHHRRSSRSSIGHDGSHRHHITPNANIQSTIPPSTQPSSGQSGPPVPQAPVHTSHPQSNSVAAGGLPIVGGGPGAGGISGIASGGSDESTEQVLLASFKAAALSVTQLYKDALKHHRAEHSKGYQAALQDFLTFISSHPHVQSKKAQGRSEDEIRQTTSLSIDDIVSFIRNAQSMNCTSAAVNGCTTNSESQQPVFVEQNQQQQAQVQAQAQAQAEAEAQAQMQAQAQAQQQHLLQQHQQEEQLQLQQQQLLLQQQHHQQQQQQQQQQQVQFQQQQQQEQQFLQGQQQQLQQPHLTLGHGSFSQTATAPGLTTTGPLFPSDAFTFTAPIFHPGLDQAALQGMFPGGPEGGIGQQMAVDSLKRRYALQEFNMAASRMAAANAARLSNPMNLDLFGFHDGQPPYKRGRR
ncbi:hypothetical protein BGZ94_005357, partial [Podila epigama]